MDDQCFDRLVQSLARPGTRRRLLAGFAAGALGAVGRHRAEAAACRPVGSVCREGANCCSRRCGDPDLAGRRYCRCQGAADCPAPDACHAATCTAGVCGVTATVDFATDPHHCGGCGRVCPTDPHGTATCAAGVCGLACDDGYFEAGGTCLPPQPFGAACAASSQCASGVCACHRRDCVGGGLCATSAEVNDSLECPAGGGPAPVASPEGLRFVCATTQISFFCSETPCPAGQACHVGGSACYPLAPPS
jgi:hypothetical protein